MNRRHFLRKLIQSLAVLSSLSWVGMKVPEIQEQPAEFHISVKWDGFKVYRMDPDSKVKIEISENTDYTVNPEGVVTMSHAIPKGDVIYFERVSDSIRGERT